jgi:Tfp pilus assembly protein PilX
MAKTTDISPRKSKSDLVREMLARRSGADLKALQEATGWQPHSVRAALSTLRKAGYTIDRMPAQKVGGATLYRITARPEAI